MPKNLILATLGMAFMISTIGLAEDRPDPVQRDQSPGAPNIDGIDVEIATESTPSSWRNKPQFFSDMGGFRTILARHGMAFEISNLDEGFGTPGGTLDHNSGGCYHGLTDVVLSLDTEDAGWWRGGRVVIDLQNVRGDDISEIVGDIQGISNIVGPPGTRIVEYFFDQTIADGRFHLKFGKQDANADFVVSSGGGEFINSSFGLIPTVPLPTFPAPALGIMGGWSPSKAFRLKAGYWDGDPELGSGVSTGIIDGSKGTVAAIGLEITPFGDRIIDGTYRIGVWRHSEVAIACPLDAAPATTLAEHPTGPADGVYFTADQGLWETEDCRLAIFAQGGWGETDRSVVSRYLGGGLTISGPFHGRPDDLVGIGVASADMGRVDRDEPDCKAETVVELFYKLPVTGWMTLNPDLQWVNNPGGTAGSTFIAGLRIATAF